MDLRTYFTALAHYHVWATRKLFEHVDALPEADYRHDGGDATRFDATLDYTTTRGIPQSLPFAATLGHVFNHGTHHRGQITAAVSAMGHPCPEIDLIWMLQADSAAARQPETSR